MKILKFIIIITIIGLLSSNFLQSQTLVIKRTDVDDADANFVTATYMFGIDIVIEDIENTHLAAFFLTFDHADYVKFSGYTIGDFGEKGEVLQGQIDDLATNTSTLSLAIYSGENSSINVNPVLVHLDFVVLQTAPNEDEIKFEFSGAIAETADSGKEFQVKSEDKTFIVHGFDDIWPGDSNRDGIVDTRDHANVGIYLGLGAEPNGKRTFKRKNASTNFYPQRVLVWDQADATFADGDGDGDISLTDGLVVFMNMGNLGQPKGKIKQIITQREDEFDSDIVSVPVSINAEEEYTAIIGYLDIDSDNYEYMGIKKGELFDNRDYSIISDKKNNGFLIGINSKEDFISKEGIAFEVLLKLRNNIPVPKTIKLLKTTGLSPNNYTFPINNYTSVDEDKNFAINLINNTLELKSISYFKGLIIITNINGNIIYNQNINFIDNYSLNIENYLNGTYFVSIIGSGIIHSEKIIISQ